MILETQRLILRGWKDEDASGLFKYASDKRVGPPAGWLPHEDEAYSRAIIRTVLAKEETYAICLKGGNDAPIGSVGLIMEGSPLRPLEKDEAELGFWVGYPYWGMGIATEAAKQLIKRGFDELFLKRIYCAYFEGNERSRRVQEKCGFRFHHKNDHSKIPMLSEERVEYFNVIDRDMWQIIKKV